ncbi:transposase [Candidatus Margulisiibacteriota bacterium]
MYEKEKIKVSKKQKNYTGDFKLQVVIESYASGNASETATKHGVHMTQLNAWRRQLLSQGADIFKRGKGGKSDDQRKIEQMEKTIGRLALQNDILKKTEELLS